MSSLDATLDATPRFGGLDTPPADLRWMNTLSRVVMIGFVLMLLAGIAVRLSQLDAFTIRAIRIDGEITRNSVSTIRANAAPHLVGNFFTLDLAAAKAAFEAVPWVRHAVVRRVWPDGLSVRLEEQRPMAIWQQDGGDDKLVNPSGEVFEANLNDVEDEALPLLHGPDGTAASMLSAWRRLAPLWLPQRERVKKLSLSQRGSWRVVLTGGAEIELGRGSEDEIVARTERFLRTVGGVALQQEHPLIYADLRHADGYALRLKGVTTPVPMPAGSLSPKTAAKAPTTTH